MASLSLRFLVATLSLAFVLEGSVSNAQLKASFYDKTCPTVSSIIRGALVNAFKTDPRIGASLIRLHAHDCFVNGCDASVLLDNSATIESEKEAAPNNNSARGFEVLDAMKASIEKTCPATVSCADILTIAAQESVTLSGGPVWKSLLGRRDSTTANRTLANLIIPGPFDTLQEQKFKFSSVGLNNNTDLVTLAGAHTFGRSRCFMFSHRLYNFENTGKPDPTLDRTYLKILQKLCPEGGNGSVLANFDPKSPDTFDVSYYNLLKTKKGLLQTDQQLFSTKGSDTVPIVKSFVNNQDAFFKSFVVSMIKMGNIKPLTGKKGQIRLNCRRVNGASSTISTISDDDLVSSF